jgi:hypothetical protein
VLYLILMKYCAGVMAMLVDWYVVVINTTDTTCTYDDCVDDVHSCCYVHGDVVRVASTLCTGAYYVP